MISKNMRISSSRDDAGLGGATSVGYKNLILLLSGTVEHTILGSHSKARPQPLPRMQVM